MPKPGTPVTAWMSQSGVAHLDLDCTGLDRMREAGYDPAQRLQPLHVDRAADLLRLADERCCRLCAAAPVAGYILEDAQASAKVFATFTLAQPASVTPKRRRDPDTTEAKLAANDRAERTAAQLNALAQRHGLHVTPGRGRPAAYGFVPSDAIDPLDRVVRLEIRRAVTELPSAEMVTTFWRLVGETGETDPWFIAESMFLTAD